MRLIRFSVTFVFSDMPAYRNVGIIPWRRMVCLLDVKYCLTQRIPHSGMFRENNSCQVEQLVPHK